FHLGLTQQSNAGQSGPFLIGACGLEAMTGWAGTTNPAGKRLILISCQIGPAWSREQRQHLGGRLAKVGTRRPPPHFERPATGLRYVDTRPVGLAATHFHDLTMRGGKPVPDQIVQPTNAEPMAEQHRSGAAVPPCIGEEFECAPLFSAELTLLMQSIHRIC